MYHPILPSSIQHCPVQQYLEFHAYRYRSVSSSAKQFVGKMSAESFIFTHEKMIVRSFPRSFSYEKTVNN